MSEIHLTVWVHTGNSWGDTIALSRNNFNMIFLMHSKSILKEYRQSLIIVLSVLIYDETIVICVNLLQILLWLDLDETVKYKCISNFSDNQIWPMLL